jgi:hypothetical protein
VKRREELESERKRNYHKKVPGREKRAAMAKKGE